MATGEQAARAGAVDPQPAPNLDRVTAATVGTSPTIHAKVAGSEQVFSKAARTSVGPTPAPDPAAGEETTARASSTLPAQVATNHHLLKEAARTEIPIQPAPDPRKATNPSPRADASLGIPHVAGQPPAALLALLADPAVAAASNTGIPHVLVPAGLVRNLVDVVLMFVGDHGSDPAAWPDADMSKLAAAHAVLARAAGITPIAKGAVPGTLP